MKIVESIRPEGYEKWAKRAAEKVQQNPEAFKPGNSQQYLQAGGGNFVTTEENEDEDQVSAVNWEPEPALEASQYVARLEPWEIVLRCEAADWLAFRISDAESQIGGGLIEEVIEVAEGELKLVNTMFEARVYVSKGLKRSISASTLTMDTGGRSSKKSHNQANGTTLRGTNILR